MEVVSFCDAAGSMVGVVLRIESNGKDTGLGFGGGMSCVVLDEWTGQCFGK